MVHFCIRSSKAFFDLEKTISSDLISDVLQFAHGIDVGLSNAQRALTHCLSFGSEDSVVQSVYLDDKAISKCGMMTNYGMQSSLKRVILFQPWRNVKP